MSANAPGKGFILDPTYPPCPRCGRYMSPIARFGLIPLQWICNYCKFWWGLHN